jgi:hypothetical protein
VREIHRPGVEGRNLIVFEIGRNKSLRRKNVVQYLNVILADRAAI